MMPASKTSRDTDVGGCRFRGRSLSGWLWLQVIVRSYLVETGCGHSREPIVVKRRAWLKVLAQLLTVAFSLVAARGALAQEIPRLVASDVPDLRGWCGDRSVYLNRLSRDSISTLTLLNIDSGKEIALQLGNRLAASGGCSPDGRWVLTDEGANWRYDGTADFDECESPKPLELPEVTLWDTLEHKHYGVGRGVLRFEWSPDGKTLLYYFPP
jgi:hypothetical protein